MLYDFTPVSYTHLDIVIAEVDGNGISTNKEKLMEERIKWIKDVYKRQTLICCLTTKKTDFPENYNILQDISGMLT